MLFSQRMGLTPIRAAIQKETMDDSLRNKLWNAFHLGYVTHFPAKKDDFPRPLKVKTSEYAELTGFCFSLWHHFFCLPVDTIPQYVDELFMNLRKQFFEFSVIATYDFIDFVVQNIKNESMAQDIEYYFNTELKAGLSAYRFANHQLVEIASEQEIAEIEQAAQITGKFTAASSHIDTAIKLLADRKTPDYRNSIKESISAVESVCKIIANDEKSTLGVALNKLDSKYPGKIHPDFKEALHKIYKYTSDEKGIRHALLEEDSNADSTDAKFMLVSCSAFTNYLISKFDE